MKKIYKIPFLILIISFVGCQDILDKEPIDIIDSNKAFQSAEDIDAGVIGVYAAMTATTYIDISSRMSDDVRLSPENRGQGVQIHDWSFAANEGSTTSAWNNCYQVVSRINRVLDAIERLTAEGVVTEADVAQSKAELLAIRALSHFDLWRIFSTKYNPSALAIPYMALPEGLQVDIKPERETTESVFTKIKADLAEAQNLMPDGFDSPTRITDLAISALRARVALYSEDWDDAITFSTQVIDNMELAGADDLKNVFSDVSNEGIVFELLRVSGDERVGTLFTDTNGDIFFNPSNEIISVYDSVNDARFDAYIEDDRTEADRDQVIKYPGKVGLDKLNDIKIFRVAEQFLIRAEAYANNNQTSLGNADLNTLRANRISGWVNQSYSQSDLLDEIMLERRRELAFEGHRFFDLKRRGLAIDREGDDCFRVPNACTLEASSFRFALPIPQSEIFASDMEQNPGYSNN
ncbi:RagB/SusD family nutrient uptake outer membrane protein [Fulvivirga ligni]|uniref:RagB/SusD family nutrient uptake outer membrane protein n=1 Tax=Fulvivirga ligni TaxID=2904246 RepID=UPI001F1EA451|nr:RagB/SusD family nutrient uptake outer membrane protein [Fulvivirga ligni]UII23488.1 RagB/SusD family nutrient uptake outer membrane protein [Fulvivirga ligni]